MIIPITIGLIFTAINIAYTILKDSVQRQESQAKECIDTLKKALYDSLNECDNKSLITANIAYVEGLKFISLISENDNKDSILKFSLAISDYHQKVLNQEELLNAYKEAIKEVYNSKITFYGHLKSIFHQK